MTPHQGGTMTETGIRDLRNHLSRYLDRVRDGEELTVTDRGRPIARIVPVDEDDVFHRLVAEGLITRAARRSRQPPPGRVVPAGPVSGLVTDQRR